MKFSKLIFLITLIMGTLITVSAYNWFGMWIGLEINLMSFIPLIYENKNSLTSEAALKYFMIQMIASMLVMFSIINFLLTEEFINLLSNPLSLILSTALLMKMGAAPFHFWFPEIMSGLNWMNALILMTWQKLAPMLVIMYNFKNYYFFSLIIILCMLISGLKSWNQSSMKKIMAYSSINHIGWMLSMMMFNQSLWMFYFLIYSFMTCSVVSLFNKFNILNFNQMFLYLNKFKSVKFSFYLNMMSMGGLPPFIGFFPKWLALNTLISNNYNFLAFMMVFSTLLLMYIYMQITFQAMMIKINEKLILNYNINTNLISFMNFINISSLMFFPILINFY